MIMKKQIQKYSDQSQRIVIIQEKLKRKTEFSAHLQT